jgi:prolyl-tRNA synthetase
VHVVIVPIYKNEQQRSQIAERAEQIKKMLEDKGFSVKFDNRETHKPGWKFAEYELKGVPVRLAIGPKDYDDGTVEVARRDTLEKKTLPQEGIGDHVKHLMTAIQQNIFQRALVFREDNTYATDSYDEMKDILSSKGGFVSAHWDGTPETEQKINEETRATIRCIPLNGESSEGKCIVSGNPSRYKVLIAKGY